MTGKQQNSTSSHTTLCSGPAQTPGSRSSKSAQRQMERKCPGCRWLCSCIFKPCHRGTRDTTQDGLVCARYKEVVCRAEQVRLTAHEIRFLSTCVCLLLFALRETRCRKQSSKTNPSWKFISNAFSKVTHSGLRAQPSGRAGTKPHQNGNPRVTQWRIVDNGNSASQTGNETAHFKSLKNN